MAASNADIIGKLRDAISKLSTHAIAAYDFDGVSYTYADIAKLEQVLSRFERRESNAAINRRGRVRRVNIGGGV